MIRKHLAALTTLVLLAPAVLAQTGATPAAPAAPSNGPTKVGIIDFVAAVALTNEGQRDLQALSAKFQPKQNELQALDKEVQDLKKQLDTQGPSLNEDARAALVKNMEAKQKALQRSMEDARNDFEAQQNEIFKRIGGKVYEALDKYAKENNYTVILDISDQQSPVRWASQGTIITSAVVTAYNASSGVPAPPKPATAPGAAKPGGAAAGNTTAKPATSTPSAPQPQSTANKPH